MSQVSLFLTVASMTFWLQQENEVNFSWFSKKEEGGELVCVLIPRHLSII